MTGRVICRLISRAPVGDHAQKSISDMSIFALRRRCLIDTAGVLTPVVSSVRPTIGDGSAGLRTRFLRVGPPAVNWGGCGAKDDIPGKGPCWYGWFSGTKGCGIGCGAVWGAGCGPACCGAGGTGRLEFIPVSSPARLLGADPSPSDTFIALASIGAGVGTDFTEDIPKGVGVLAGRHDFENRSDNELALTRGGWLANTISRITACSHGCNSWLFQFGFMWPSSPHLIHMTPWVLLDHASSPRTNLLADVLRFSCEAGIRYGPWGGVLVDWTGGCWAGGFGRSANGARVEGISGYAFDWATC